MTDRNDTPTDHPFVWRGILDPAQLHDEVAGDTTAPKR
jgi:hypothetical protein